jgi:hypothetical protein
MEALDGITGFVQVPIRVTVAVGQLEGPGKVQQAVVVVANPKTVRLKSSSAFSTALDPVPPSATPTPLVLRMAPMLRPPMGLTSTKDPHRNNMTDWSCYFLIA